MDGQPGGIACNHCYIQRMGHPFEALAWIANSFAARGKCLLEGEFVLLGSLVETKWVERGDVVTIEQPGIGAATARFV